MIPESPARRPSRQIKPECQISVERNLFKVSEKNYLNLHLKKILVSLLSRFMKVPSGGGQVVALEIHNTTRPLFPIFLISFYLTQSNLVWF